RRVNSATPLKPRLLHVQTAHLGTLRRVNSATPLKRSLLSLESLTASPLRRVNSATPLKPRAPPARTVSVARSSPSELGDPIEARARVGGRSTSGQLFAE